ncbi:MAG: hypothetical protein AAGF11_36550 [Myxococcota bacterium]
MTSELLHVPNARVFEIDKTWSSSGGRWDARCGSSLAMGVEREQVAGTVGR